MVYVIANNGTPLMPTERHGKVKHLLREGRAKVVRREPFTVQLLYESGMHVQSVTLGVDAGSKTVGLSVTTESKELYVAEIALRSDVTGLISSRSALRRTRRNRKTRYRKPRFENRVHGKHKGWLAPTVEQKIHTHIQAIANVHKLLPISSIVVEVASFDIQKIKNPDIQSNEYQQGEQMGFWNVREYVLFRDGHECQCCHGKSKDKALNVHHIESRKTGGETPNNLVTLCETCHKAYHAGKVKLNIKRGRSLRDAAFMGIMRRTMYNRLKTLYTDVKQTYGYITKNTRIRNHLEKTHCVDARCITGNPMAKPLDCFYRQKARRTHNRQIHKLTICSGGYRKTNQSAHEIFGYRLFDKVRMPDGCEGFIFGKRTSGSFDVRRLDGTKLSAGISNKKLKLVQRAKTILTERQVRATSSPCPKTGVSVA